MRSVVMHIVFDARPLQSASRNRGIGRFAYEVLAALYRRAPDLQYTFLQVSGGTPPRLPKGVNGRTLSYPGRVPEQLRGLADALILRGLLAKAAGDLYYSPEYGLPSSSPIPAVVTVHDLIPWVLRHPSYLRQRIRWGMQRRLLGRAARLLCDSKSTRLQLMAKVHVEAARTLVIYPGVSQTFFATPPAADVKTIRSRYGQGFALFVGECDWRKRPEHALAAIAPTDRRLLIVGPNQRHAARLRRLATQAGVSDRVTVAGMLTDRELVAAYASASVLLFPSRYEGFGLPLLEAAAMGVPAVAYNNSSIPEAAGEGTHLVEEGDLRQFVGEAVGIIKRSRPAGDPAKAKARAREFTWDRTAEQMLNAFTQVT